MADKIARVVRLRNRGLSYGEIAKRVRTTRGSVAGILHRVRNPRPVRPKRPYLDISLVSDLPAHEARYILAVTLGLGLSATGRMIGRTAPTVRYSCHRVEDRRDDPDYDNWLTEIEYCKLREAETGSDQPTREPTLTNDPHLGS